MTDWKPGDKCWGWVSDLNIIDEFVIDNIGENFIQMQNANGNLYFAKDYLIFKTFREAQLYVIREKLS